MVAVCSARLMVKAAIVRLGFWNLHKGVGTLLVVRFSVIGHVRGSKW